MLVLGFKGMQIEEHAREVMAYVAQLGRDFTRFREDFELVGSISAGPRRSTATRRSDSSGSRRSSSGGRVEEPEELSPRQAELPRALDAA